MGQIAHVHRLSRAWYYGTEPDVRDGREAMWSQLIAQPGRTTHLLETARRVLGFISAARTTDRPNTLELTALYVLPECVGAGVGTMLYEQFAAERRDHEEGLLEVWSGNSRAAAFYARRGWTPTGDARPGPQGRDFVAYRLAIGWLRRPT